MATKKIFFIFSMLTHFSLLVSAQVTPVEKSTWAIETRISTYIQGGYDLGIYYYPKNTKFSFGALFARHDINGAAKELLFNSSDHDPLSLRLNWIISLQPRYHFGRNKEGIFLEAGMGVEEFRVSSGGETHNNINGFIAPSLGYIWYPWQQEGFYLQPKVAGVFILSREDEQLVNGTSYQLKSFFPTPSFAIGWKF